MPDADVIRVAEAVKNELNDPARNWSKPFAAERLYYASFDDADIQQATGGVKVSILGVTDEHVALPALSRARRHEVDIGVMVDVQAKLADAKDRQEVDGWVNFMDSLRDWFADLHALAGLTDWSIQEVAYVSGLQTAAVYDWAALYTDGRFESALDLTVRGYRS